MHHNYLFSEKGLDHLAQKSTKAKRMFDLLDETDNYATRSRFARDRDRIIFCKSFRRLIHKTQLYISHGGNDHQRNEHQRTRLTHTVEVVQIARVIAKNLLMNEELVEAIAYGHDVGHAPFGHVGERKINNFLRGKEPFTKKILDSMSCPEAKTNCMAFKKDFRHNFQSIRILTYLEDYHPDYRGLNLTIPCLEGILKHTSMKSLLKDGSNCNFPEISNGVFKELDLDVETSTSVEGQIVAIADEIAQVTHDINDALMIEALTIERLEKIGSIKEIIDRDTMRYPPSIHDCQNKKNKQYAQISSALLNYFIFDIISIFQESLSKIPKKQQKLNGWIIPVDDDGKIIWCKAFKELRDLKNNIVLNNFLVNRMDSKGEYIIGKLFEAYMNDPRQLPDNALDRYCKMKKYELPNNAQDKIKFITKWINEQEQFFKITDRVKPNDVMVIIDFLDGENGGREFRALSPDLIIKLRPYLNVDGDFLRCIADHIAGMTDVFAQEEFTKLYI